MGGLGYYGTNAQAAIPLLQSITKTNFQSAIRRAMNKIDPDGAARETGGMSEADGDA